MRFTLAALATCCAAALMWIAYTAGPGELLRSLFIMAGGYAIGFLIVRMWP